MNKNPQPHYYKYIGYSDRSGRPGGLIIKYLTEEQYEHKVKCGLRFEQVPQSQENHTI